jgi:hypothetical protein
MARPPLLTKPAGVFVQLLGALVLFAGLAMLGTGHADGITLGIVLIIAAIGLFGLGRQTKPRDD